MLGVIVRREHARGAAVFRQKTPAAIPTTNIEHALPCELYRLYEPFNAFPNVSMRVPRLGNKSVAEIDFVVPRRVRFDLTAEF